jgi:hypothetical protein
MHPFPHGHGNPLQRLLIDAKRLAGPPNEGRLGLVFQGITAVSLGAMSVINVIDMIRKARHSHHDPAGPRHR